jgi:hypothetical protein
MTGVDQKVGIGSNRCKQLALLVNGIGEREIGIRQRVFAPCFTKTLQQG